MTRKQKSLLLAFAATAYLPTGAQVSAYIFAQSNGTYIPITGGTVIATATANTAPANLGNTVWTLPNGTFSFPFVFNGIPYTGCNISCNGYITFGSVVPTNIGNPISNTAAYDGAIVAWGRTTNGVYNLGSGPFYTSELRVEELGTAPNRTFVIQFENWRYASGTTTTTWLHNYQIRLIETTNVVEIVYGDGIMAGGSLTTSGFNCQVGLRGATNSDFNNRSSFGLFNASTTGTVNSATQVIGVTSGVGIFMPPSGLTYRWHPPCTSGSPVSSTITANTTTLCEGETVNFGAMGATPFFDIVYQWQLSNSPGGPYSNVSGTDPGTAFATYNSAPPPGLYYYVLLTTCPGSSATAISNEITIDVKPLPAIDLVSTPGLNTTVTPVETCLGETYTLTAMGAASYTWAGGPTTDTYVVQPVNNPVYTVTGMSSDGCLATKVYSILVHPQPVVGIIVAPPSICPGNSVVIAAGGNAVTYTWTSPNSNAFLITVSPSVTTNYTVTGTAATGCTNAAVQQVHVYPVTPVIATSSHTPDIMCKGDETILSATGAGSFTWATPGTYTVGNPVIAAPDVTTTFTVTAVDFNGCVSRSTVTQSVSACAGLAASGFFPGGIDLFPNPTSGVFVIRLADGVSHRIELMDINGRILMTGSISAERPEVDITDLTPGIYYLRLHSSSGTRVAKVVKS